MKINELIGNRSADLYESSTDVTGVLGQVAADYATEKGYQHVGTAINTAAQAFSGDYLGAASTVAQAAGQKKLGGALSAMSNVVTATPLGTALDLVSKIAYKDPDLAEKIKKAAADAKSTGTIQSFSHPLDLLGPLNLIPSVYKMFTGKNMQLTLQVNPQGQVIAPENKFLNNS